MKRLVPIVLVAVAAYIALAPHSSLQPEASAPVSSAPIAEVQPAEQDGSALARAFATHARNVRVEGEGRVVKVLPDDNEGSRHQRFLVRLRSGQTILIAHNIDLAPPVTALEEGDSVEFSGEYEWNPRGGVVHWTHRDPSGRHPAGWLRHGGQVYQ